MKLHAASVKLASLYLLILMIISLAFSASLYQLSVQELERSARRPIPNFDNRIVPNIMQELQSRFSEQRLEALAEAKRRLLMQLVLTNLLIMTLGGLLSYYLAERTLRPIERAKEAQSRFTADASHELRTPITALMTENEVALLDDTLTVADARKQFESNIEELTKLTQLTEGLLTLARVGEQPLELQPVNVRDSISAAVERVQQSATQKSITLSVEKTKLLALANQESLTELIVILLDNAIKYGPKKSTVKVTCKAEGRQVAISVKDRGEGISKEDQAHIFKRFYRADQSRNKNIDGFGIGLSIAQSIAQAHHGSISVASSAKGSIFTVHLSKA